MCHTPIVNWGLSIEPRPFSTSWQWKKLKKTVLAWPIATIGHNTCPMAVSSGFYQSPGPPPSGNARTNVPAHCRGHQNGQQSWSIFSSFFHLLSPWRLPGQYGASSCLMVGSSGFEGSPGHAASGDAVCIAPTHMHGYQNGLQQRCICFLRCLFWMA